VLYHKRPGIPLYRILLLYHRHRNTLIEINGGLVYDGYLDVARRFLFNPHDDPRRPRHQPSERAEMQSIEAGLGTALRI
jgi:hypothetical protein